MISDCYRGQGGTDGVCSTPGNGESDRKFVAQRMRFYSLNIAAEERSHSSRFVYVPAF
jgi:hypothetical protein